MAIAKYKVTAKGLVEAISLEKEPGLPASQLMLVNHELKSVERARRRWGPWNFVGFWIADSFNINTWMRSSSLIVGGLSWWQSWLCVWAGYAAAACFICATGRVGAAYHVGFPVACRSSFGIWGSLWPVFNRAVMAIWLPVHQARHLFTAKSYLVPPAGVGFLIWVVVRAGGLGPIIRQPSTIHGADLAWQIVLGIMSSIANFASLIVNNSDFSRFARKPKDTLWSQLIAIPTSFAITSLIGIIVSSSSVVIYPDATEPPWNPLHLLERLLDEGGSAERFGVFVIALAFALAQLGTNMFNSVSAGTDMTALLPRFISIRRGGYICAAVGLAMCPYTLLTSANQFTTYLSAYSVFLSSIAGVMCTDYYVVRKGYLATKELYCGRNSGPYYFWYGFNPRAYAAYIAGIAINVVGLVGAVGTKVPVGATYIYNFNYFGGFLLSGVIY